MTAGMEEVTHLALTLPAAQRAQVANALLDRVQACCKRLVMVEGNHEYRLDRWAAQTSESERIYG